MSKKFTSAPALVLSVLLTLGTSTSVNAVTTYGVPSCAQWASEAHAPITRSWLLGYMTAANDVWLALRANPPAEPLALVRGADAMYQYIDAFCKANPNETALTGAQKLFIELERRATGGK